MHLKGDRLKTLMDNSTPHPTSKPQSKPTNAQLIGRASRNIVAIGAVAAIFATKAVSAGPPLAESASPGSIEIAATISG